MGEFTHEQVSIAGAPTIKFTFSGDVVHACLDGAPEAAQLVGTTTGEARNGVPTEAHLVFTASDGFVLADITVHERPAIDGKGPMCLSENVMSIAASVLWSHWRYLRSKAGHRTHVQALRDIIARADASDRSCDAASLVDELRKIVSSLDATP